MHKRVLYLIIGISVWLATGCTVKKQVVRSDDHSKSNQIPYQLFNARIGGQVKRPLIIFLHGSGERGHDNQKQTVHVVPYLTSDSIQKKYPSIVVSPQCPEKDYWAPVKRFEWSITEGGRVTPAMAAVMNLIEELRKNPDVDTSRIYVIGLSMGGFGTLDLISRKPEWFAAAVPICGGADLKKADKFQSVPLWVFHGAEDSVVPVKLSRELVHELTSRGVSVKYTEYVCENHGIWEKAVREPGFLEWLFSQHVSGN